MEFKDIMPEDDNQIFHAAVLLSEGQPEEMPDEAFMENLKKYFEENNITGNDRQLMLYEFLMEKDPNSAWAMNIAVTCLHKKDYEKALDYFLKARELEGVRKIPQLHYFLYYLYVNGLGTKADEKKAFEILDEYCDYVYISDYFFCDEEERKSNAVIYYEYGSLLLQKLRYYDAVISHFNAYLWDPELEDGFNKARKCLAGYLRRNQRESFMEDSGIKYDEGKKLFRKLINTLYSGQNCEDLFKQLREEIIFENRVIS